MFRSTSTLSILGAFVLVMTAAAHPVDQPTAATGHADIWTADQGQWMPFPDVFPPGAQFKVIHGNPATGAATFYMRFPPGYNVPWHFHVPVETVLVDKGTLQFEVRGGQKSSLGEGSSVRMPSRVPHRASCSSSGDCMIYLESSDAFDIYLVDDRWKVTRSWSAADAHTPKSTGSK